MEKGNTAPHDSLEEAESLIDRQGTTQSLPSTKHWRQRFPTLLCMVIIVLLAYNAVVTTLHLLARTRNDHGLDMPYSPANPALSYEKHRYWDGEHSLYGRKPDAEVDQAWDDLLAGVNIRASHEEMVLAGEELEASAQVVDGDYVAVLGVYHQLHCLNVLRKLVHKDYYMPNFTAEEWQSNVFHWSHCIDSLRRSSMCHADVAMYSTQWIAGSHTFPSKKLRSNAEAICVDWSRVSRWAEDRALERDKFLLRPGPFEHLNITDASEFDR